jgi:sterol desaturase/sphingolipid hydroxylase (fatty acid hydroxylase superfamily)
MKSKLSHRLIGQWPKSSDISREIKYSLLSTLIFAAIGAVIFSQYQAGRITVYFEPGEYGWTWLLISFPLFLVWHDTYFYWTHRLLHTKWFFRHVHSLHHRSRHPSPFAAFAFHPVEAFLNGLVMPIALLTVPLHIGVVLLFIAHQMIRNAHGHAAVETMPQGFVTHWLFGRLTTTTHHHMHHEASKNNYGLWFTWWDRLLKTEDSNYFKRFSATFNQDHGATDPRASLSQDDDALRPGKS